ncbi:MAG: oxidoreductase, partial [Anaerolineales bacterium]|nr:oxidoreductase [Anaerolineales bacterium]
DIEEYIALTGDNNPIYSDPEVARMTGFEGSVVPGPLLGGMFSYLLGTKLPGRGTNYLKQSFRFSSPAYPNEEITASVEVVRLRPEKNLVDLRTLCTNTRGENLCEGEALVLVRDLEKTV